MNKIWLRRIGVALATIVVSTLAGSAVLASIPDGDGVIHSCYRADGPAQGTLVVIDDAVESCPTGYTSLDWNQQGPAGVSGYEVVVDTGVTASPTYTVSCPAGKKAISGGVKWNGLGTIPIDGSAIVASYPTSGATGWTIAYRASGGTLDVYAVCAFA